MTSNLPLSNAPWPPAPFDQHQTNVDLLHAWWAGDTARLVSPSHPGVTNDPYRPGAAAAVARAVGRGRTPAARPLHVPVAEDLCNASATLMAGEAPSIAIPQDGGNEQAIKRLDLLVNNPTTHADLLTGEASAAALGDVYARVSWDKGLADQAWIEFIDGDRGLPTYRKGRLRAVTFWEVLPGAKDEVWRHLEVHTPGRIEHGLYRGNREMLGVRMPLEAHEATRGIPGENIPTGTKRMTACHIPNRGPNVPYRRDPVLRHLGRADITEPLMGLMWEVNAAYSSLARDIRLSKARLILSDQLVRPSAVPGAGGAFDVDQEAFATVRGNPTADPLIEAHQFDIRVTDLTASIDTYVRAILRNAGYSPTAFGMKDDMASSMTATEVEARDRASSSTKGAKALHRQAALSELATALLEVDAAVFGTGAQVSEPVEVDYSPAVTPTQLQLAMTAQAMDTARAASTRTKVDLLHPDWDEKRREQETERILAEQSNETFVDPFQLPQDTIPQDQEDPEDPDLDLAA